MTLAENIDINCDMIDGGGTPGRWRTQIDVKKLPMTLLSGKCVGV